MLHKNNKEVAFASYLKKNYKDDNLIVWAALTKDVHQLSVGELMDVVQILREELYLQKVDLSQLIEKIQNLLAGRTNG